MTEESLSPIDSQKLYFESLVNINFNSSLVDSIHKPGNHLLVSFGLGPAIEDYRDFVVAKFRGRKDDPEFWQAFNTQAWLRVLGSNPLNRKLELYFFHDRIKPGEIRNLVAGEIVRGTKIKWSHQLSEGNSLFVTR